MINSYQCYRKHCEMNEIDAMTHYKFQCMIAIFWLDESFYEKMTIGDTSSRSVSSISTMMNVTQRRARVCDSSVHPITGAIKCRLKECVHHWHIAPDNGAGYRYHCQFYYWASRIRKYTNVQVCKDCNVSLCTDGCYERFHTAWGLLGEKEQISQDCEDKWLRNKND